MVEEHGWEECDGRGGRVRESVAQGVDGLVMCDRATGFNRRCGCSEGQSLFSGRDSTDFD